MNQETETPRLDAIVQPLLEKLIRVLESPALTQGEVIELFESLPESEKQPFQAAVKSIVDGVNSLRTIHEKIVC